MNTLATQIAENSMSVYGTQFTDSEEFFLTEQHLLEFLMEVG